MGLAVREEASAHDLPTIVDGKCIEQINPPGIGGYQRIKVGHQPVVVEEGTSTLRTCGVGLAHHLAEIVDAFGYALSAIQGAEISHHSVAVEKGAIHAVAVRGRAHDLAAIVDAVG